jgi:hypothetical protein
LTADLALEFVPDGMQPLDAIEQANLVMGTVLQACPPGDVHDEIRRAIAHHLAQLP